MKILNENDGLSTIYIPPIPKIAKKISEVDQLLDNKQELLFEVEKNRANFSKEILEYLKSLLMLETSVLKHDDLNAKILEYKIFREISKYNLYERIVNVLKNSQDIDLNKIEVNVIGEFKKYFCLKREINNCIVSEFLEIRFAYSDLSDIAFYIKQYDSEILKVIEVLFEDWGIHDYNRFLKKQETNECGLEPVKSLSWVNIYVQGSR